MGRIYKKWRKLNISPRQIKYKNIKIIKMISFPHCGNDVIECECFYKKNKIKAFSDLLPPL